MGNLLFHMGAHFGILTVAADTAEEPSLVNRIFGLDQQLLIDSAILALSMFVLFLLLSYLLFNPARELLRKRQAKIQEEMEFSTKQKQEAIQFKAEYDSKLKSADKQVDDILSEGRKKAQRRENDIVDEATAEAARIMARAKKEVELEKSKVKDEMKQEMVSLASVMAGKIMSVNIDAAKQAKLVEEALDEMGDNTWQN